MPTTMADRDTLLAMDCPMYIASYGLALAGRWIALDAQLAMVVSRDTSGQLGLAMGARACGTQIPCSSHDYGASIECSGQPGRTLRWLLQEVDR